MARDLTEALANLSQGVGQTTGQAKNLPATKPPATIPPRTGSSGRVTPSGRGGGISSPLTEVAYSQREFYTSTTITSVDGLFSLVIKPVKQISFADADGAAAVLKFKAPT